MNFHLFCIFVIQIVWFVTDSVVNSQNLQMLCDKWKENNYMIRVYRPFEENLLLIVDQLYWAVVNDDNNRLIFLEGTWSYAKYPHAFVQQTNNMSSIFSMTEFFNPSRLLTAYHDKGLTVDFPLGEIAFGWFLHAKTWNRTYCKRGVYTIDDLILKGHLCGIYNLHSNGTDVTIEDIKGLSPKVSISYFDYSNNLNAMLIQTDDQKNRRVFYFMAHELRVNLFGDTYHKVNLTVIPRSGDLDSIVKLDPRHEVIGLFGNKSQTTGEERVFVVIRDHNVIKYCLLNDCLANKMQELIDCNKNHSTTTTTTSRSKTRTPSPSWLWIARNDRPTESGHNSLFIPIIIIISLVTVFVVTILILMAILKNDSSEEENKTLAPVIIGSQPPNGPMPDSTQAHQTVLESTPKTNDTVIDGHKETISQPIAGSTASNSNSDVGSGSANEYQSDSNEEVFNRSNRDDEEL